jgi:hypothetical protein
MAAGPSRTTTDTQADAALRRTDDRALDSQHLTVLGVLHGLGATVGLSVGFNVGGWQGLVSGLLSGILTPVILALAFRSRKTRYWLAAIADWVVERPLEEAVKDVHQLAHGLDDELEKALHRLHHATERGHMWPPAQAPPATYWDSHGGDLRTLGWHFHKPVHDAYSKIAGLNELARQRADDDSRPAGVVEPQGTSGLSEADRRRLSDADEAVNRALARLRELEQARRP